MTSCDKRHVIQRPSRPDVKQGSFYDDIKGFTATAARFKHYYSVAFKRANQLQDKRRMDSWFIRRAIECEPTVIFLQVHRLLIHFRGEVQE